MVHHTAAVGSTRSSISRACCETTSPPGSAVFWNPVTWLVTSTDPKDQVIVGSPHPAALQTCCSRSAMMRTLECTWARVRYPTAARGRTSATSSASSSTT